MAERQIASYDQLLYQLLLLYHPFKHEQLKMCQLRLHIVTNLIGRI